MKIALLSTLTRIIVVALIVCDGVAHAEEFELSSWSTVAVGVADLDVALNLWVDEFGMEVVVRSAGADSGLASLWDISADDIARQAIVKSPGAVTGMLHLVEFVDPSPPIRAGAEVFDTVPKNLDVYVDDLPRRFVELKKAGRAFRSENFSEVTAPDGISFREIHMPSHDEINVVLLEVMGEEMTFSSRGYAAVGPLIAIVPSAIAEKRFYREVIGLELLSDNVLKGPEIEKMIGLPPGAALDVSIWGRNEYELGQIEIIEYGGVSGRNLYPRARPKALGILHVAYETPDLGLVVQRLIEHAVPFAKYENIRSLLGTGSAVSFRSPAGLRIEVHERS